MNKQELENKTSKRSKGIVRSVAGEKTVVVEVVTLKTLKKYHKKYKSGKRYTVHDENNSAEVGQEVIFEECRPMSKTKKWKIVSSDQADQGEKK